LNSLLENSQIVSPIEFLVGFCFSSIQKLKNTHHCRIEFKRTQWRNDKIFNLMDDFGFSTSLSTIYQLYISSVSFIGGGNRSTWK
jgi:hypothetical protein